MEDEAVRPEDPASDELREPRRTLASTRACVIVGVVAFVVQLLIVKSNGVAWPRALSSASFLGVFTGLGRSRSLQRMVSRSFGLGIDAERESETGKRPANRVK